MAPIPLAAEPITHLGPFMVTNTMVNAWIVTVFFCVVAAVAARRKTLVPTGIHTVIESVIDVLAREMEKVTGDRARARQFFPLVATIFFVVLANNWLGLFPGMGTVGVYGVMHGEIELIPLLRSAGSDLNFTLSLALVAVIFSHFAGVRAVGIVSYVSKFVNIKGIVTSLKHGPMAIVTAVIEFGVGLIEIIGEFAKTLSLSLRLFGNVFAGEILITVMLGLASFVVPIPFMFLEILVGVVQATVFAMLTLVYLLIATTPHGEHESTHH
jgi:F-type H+-transporting ATPase subunit a